MIRVRADATASPGGRIGTEGGRLKAGDSGGELLQAVSIRVVEISSDDTGRRERGEPGDGGSGSARPVVLLAIGAAAGLLLAAVGLFDDDPAGEARLPEGAIATVNGTPLRQVEYERLVAALRSDTRSISEEALRKRVLDRMIDEELLVQQALSLGLATTDRRVRGDLTSAVISSVVLEAEGREPAEEELRAFYADFGDFFAAPGRLRVRQVFVRLGRGDGDGPTSERAETARRRLGAGEDFDVVLAELGDVEISPVPDALLPPGKLREYVGPSAVQAVLALEVGEVSEVLRSGFGFHVLELVEREPAGKPPLEDVEQQVRSEWRRRQGDDALRAYLDDLRARSAIRGAEDAPL